MEIKLELCKILIAGDLNTELTAPTFNSSDCVFQPTADFGFKLTVGRETRIRDVTLRFRADGPWPMRFFRNGFISWSPSYEIEPAYKERVVPWKVLWAHYLDTVYPQPEIGHFFTYLRSGDCCVRISPSTWESLVHFRLNSDRTLDVIVEFGQRATEFTFAGLEVVEDSAPVWPHARTEKLWGWTSWYYYYTRINAQELLKNTKHLVQIPVRLSLFQIDDGWEQRVGDWYENERFPTGSLRHIADEARAAGMSAGIWMAPFICERRSRLFTLHRDWLLQDSDGSPVVAGFNPLWSGYFYALDVTHPEVQSYLQERIAYLLDQGFTMFKFDFLYAGLLEGQWYGASTRYEAFLKGMELLRRASAGALIMGCGAPVMPATGFYDILRIGPDTADNWEDRLLKALAFGGRVSAYNALRNSVNRAILGNSFFLRDPDVVFLRPKRLSREERRTLILANYLLSDVIFFSDPLYGLDHSDFDLLIDIQREIPDFRIEDVRGTTDLYVFTGSCSRGKVRGYLNLSDTVHPLNVQGKELLRNGADGIIGAHQMRIFLEEADVKERG
ncbi:alpha-galactosidase [Coprothermobacteraceae bacterium]|nr:alpha-galactosidase [Coprothermobacteraceae bacterium]